MLDVKITNATVVDGTGNQPFVANLGIANGRIVQIGTELPQAHIEISAADKVIAPGFIDMHSHSDLRLLDSPAPQAKISQGITTELLGQDGLGTAPVNSETLPQLQQLTAGLLGSRPIRKWRWRSFSDYLAVLHDCSLPNNQAVLISHGPVRLAAMGNIDRPPNKEEMKQIRSLVAGAMEAGAFGFSTGLIYPPGSFAKKDELTAIAETVALYDGVFVIHLRDEGYNLPSALEEAIEVCRVSGCHLHISHLQAYGEVNWHHLPGVLERISEARSSEVPTTCDRYPYLAGSTVLSAVLPAWVLDGGPQAAINRLADEKQRKAIHEAFEEGLEVWHNRSISVGWENIMISWVKSHENTPLIGKSIAQISEDEGKNPIDVVCDLLLEEELEVTMISHYGSEDNLKRIYRHPASVVATDGIYGGRPHPRLWGTFPRFFSRYIRDKGLINLPEAVQKTSSFPADILGLSDRGRIETGKYADLVIFDFENIADKATYENPEQTSKGIDWVLVNGQPAFTPETATHKLPGQILRRI